MTALHRCALLAGFAAAAGLLVSQPAGKSIPLSNFPMASAASPDGKYVVVLEGGSKPPSVSLHEAGTLKELNRLALPDAWLGLAFAPSGKAFYVGGGSSSAVYEVGITAEAKLELRREFVVVPQAKRKPTDFIGDVAVSPDGRLVFAAALYRDSIIVINPQSGMVIEEWKTGHRPYRIVFHPDGKSYFVTGWADGSLYQHKSISGELMMRLPLGPQPMDMVLRDKAVRLEPGEEKPPYEARLYVALSGSNEVVVIGINGDKSLSRLEKIDVGLFRYQPAGMTPSALALSPDQESLYVVCSDANAVEQVQVAGKLAAVDGFIPTGSYPTAARVLPDGSVLVLNGRGAEGGGQLIAKPSQEAVAAYTRVVMKNSPLKEMSESGARVAAPIYHVLYVVKEGRTYDEVLGDLGSGNGDASLTKFPEAITPNHHKLAREFVLLDNFYVNGETGADGHNWSAAAIAPAYVQRLWPNSLAGRREAYDYEGGERAAAPPAGYIWTNVVQRGLTFRNYGWWVSNVTPAPESGNQVAKVLDPGLTDYTNMAYRGFDPAYKDVDRVKAFIKDLQGFESTGQMPRFIAMRLDNDRTAGGVADNDAALGMLVEAVSQSKFWANIAIFIIESDAPGGRDHVDPHRAPAFIVSPFTRARGVDSTKYNTVSVLRTMEAILSLRAMTMHDAGARVMSAAFNTASDVKTYVAVNKPN